MRIGVGEFKKIFFRPEAVTNPLDRAKQKRLSRFGYFVMRDARQSIRNPPRVRVRYGDQGRDDKGRFTAKKTRPASSKPGNPPYNQTSLLKRFVYFGWDASSQSVVSGPAAFKNGRITEAIEYGGEATNNGRRLRYEERPFMRPAFAKQLAKQGPQLMRDAI
jgi:hypothetical protein